ncbi:MAG: hypothetical protein ACI82H_000369 [Alphaproteobacteria bacterium]|jgi:hypothetical protein
MKRFTSPAIAASLAIALTGACANKTMVTDTDYRDSYNPLNFSLYHGNRDTRVSVAGDTLGTDSGNFATAVTKAMYGNHDGQRTNFTTNPGPSAEKNLHVIMAFNVEQDRYLCETGGKLVSKSVPGKTVLQGAWCWGDQTQSYVLAMAPATKPGEPAFSNLISETTQDLFGPIKDDNPRVDDSGDNLP